MTLLDLKKCLTISIMMDDALSLGLITYEEWRQWEQYKINHPHIETFMLQNYQRCGRITD